MANILPGNIEYEHFLGKQESQFIRPASDFYEETLALRDRQSAPATPDVLLPWSKSWKSIHLTPGHVSVWAGINGHGKTTMLSQIMLWLMPHTRILIASLEMTPAETMNRMTRQAAGCHLYSTEFLKYFQTQTDEHLWIYDQAETIQSERILGLAYYAASVLGIKHIVIDNLAKLGFSKDKYDGPWQFVDRLTYIAKNNNCHIHVVHHMRKGERESDIPGKFDLRGAGEIADIADSVYIVHRNLQKLAKLEKAETDAEREEIALQPDAALIAAKQRHQQWIGKINLWYHAPSEQYIPNPTNRPMPWPDENQLMDREPGEDG